MAIVCLDDWLIWISDQHDSSVLPLLFEFQHAMYTDQSLLKPLATEMNYIDHLATVQYSAGKLWIPSFLWMPNDTKHPAQHPCSTCNPTWHWSPRTVCAVIPQKKEKEKKNHKTILA